MVIKRWLQQLQSRREQAAVARRSIPDDLWKRTLVRYPYLQRRSADDTRELRRLTSLLLDRKEFSTTGGLRLTDAMAVTIAAQAALPVLRLGVQAYDSFLGIVVDPGSIRSRRAMEDNIGIVHEYDEVQVGEVIPGGPLKLSWPDVRASVATTEKLATASCYNVVMHECAHVLDNGDGAIDGAPPLPPQVTYAAWMAALHAAMQVLEDRVATDAPSCIDPYALQSPPEFFAVTSEAFFTMPSAMKKEHAAWYDMLRLFYRQDPAEEGLALAPRS